MIYLVISAIISLALLGIILYTLATAEELD